MRILMVSDFYPPYLGGVEILVQSLSHELAARGHHLAVATLATGQGPVLELDGPVRVHRIRGSAQRVERLFATPSRPWAPPVPDPEAALALRRIVAREQPDVVHGHDWLARSYLPLARRGRLPAFVMSVHYFTLTCPKKTLMYRGAPCIGPGLVKCLRCAGRHYGRAKGAAVVLGLRAFSPLEAARVALFLPVSTATAEGNGLPDTPLPYEVVPNFVPAEVDPAPHATLLEELPAEPFLLFAGDLRREKGAHVLLEAYRSLVASRSPASVPPLVLIGKVWPDTPRELPAGVTLLRDWPNAAVRAAMRRCLALVMPSVWPEPFGIVAAEALVAGRPVVGSAIGGIPDIVEHEREGLLVAPDDPGALAGGIARILDDGALRESLAARASQAAARYSPENIVPLVEQAYGRAVTLTRRAR